MAERWRLVALDPRYQVSDLGRIRGRYGRILKPTQNSSRGGRNAGYFKVCLGRTGPQRYVHQLVAAAFLGPCPAGHDVDHIDFDRANNTVVNLRYLPLLVNRVRWCGPGRSDFVVVKHEEQPETHIPMTEDEHEQYLAEHAAAGW